MLEPMNVSSYNKESRKVPYRVMLWIISPNLSGKYVSEQKEI